MLYFFINQNINKNKNNTVLNTNFNQKFIKDEKIRGKERQGISYRWRRT